MGDDLRVANAARVSMKKWHGKFTMKGEVDPYTSDEELIEYLAKHNHITPFFHPQLTFRIKIPIFVVRQYWRSVIGFARNEVSRRYVDDEPDLFLPEYLRMKAPNIKQGSLDQEIPSSNTLIQEIQELHEKSINLYDEMICDGVAPEQARIVLPQAMFTEFIETGSLYAYYRAYSLRIAPDAQKEIQELAQALDNIISPLYPTTWKYLKKYDPIKRVSYLEDIVAMKDGVIKLFTDPRYPDKE